MEKVILSLIFCLSLSSCATMFTGSKAKIILNSDVKEKATLTIDERKYTDVMFPFTVKVRKGFSPTQVKADVEGYKPSILVIDKTFNATTVWNIFNGCIGFAVDAATGAMMKPEYNQYDLDIKK